GGDERGAARGRESAWLRERDAPVSSGGADGLAGVAASVLGDARSAGGDGRGGERGAVAAVGGRREPCARGGRAGSDADRPGPGKEHGRRAVRGARVRGRRGSYRAPRRP